MNVNRQEHSCHLAFKINSKQSLMDCLRRINSHPSRHCVFAWKTRMKLNLNIILFWMFLLLHPHSVDKRVKWRDLDVKQLLWSVEQSKGVHIGNVSVSDGINEKFTGWLVLWMHFFSFALAGKKVDFVVAMGLNKHCNKFYDNTACGRFCAK